MSLRALLVAKAMDKTLDKEMAPFQTDLLQSVRQMKAGKAARTSLVTLTPAAEARTKVGVSQADFALNRCLDHLDRGQCGILQP